ncbi:MAG: hypothetical protein J6X60_02615, partial [Ruminiclostridium sp.]|nr:hypothetical protein [Ruminiclostridium sp.]
MSNSTGSGSKAKAVIILAAAAVIAVGGILIYLALKANEDNKAAALKANFTKYWTDSFNNTEVYDPDADYDGDKIINSKEIEARTSLILSDTDGDGLNDKNDEKYGTDPTGADSDGDEISDGIEIRAGLDPLSLITDGKTKDS